MKPASNHHRVQGQARPPFAVEPLEPRSLLSIALSGGVLSVGGTNAGDRIEVDSDAANIWVDLNGGVQSFNLADVQSLRIDCGNGKDWVSVDDQVLVDSWISGGNGKDHLDGGGGDDELHGGTGKDFLDGAGGDNLLDGDQGNDTELNGLSADLDLELSTDLHSTTGASGHAEFEMEQEDSGTEVEFEVEVEDALPNSVLDVLVDGFLVGQIATDDSGSGELRLSNDPDEAGESTFPSDFPPVAAGSVVAVGGDLQGVLASGIEFSLYNWDVSVGDTLDLASIIRSGSLTGITLDGDARFTGPFEAGQTVTITPDMLQGGDHGPGRYRIAALDDSDHVLDHFTIRIE